MHAKYPTGVLLGRSFRILHWFQHSSSSWNLKINKYIFITSFWSESFFARQIRHWIICACFKFFSPIYILNKTKLWTRPHVWNKFSIFRFLKEDLSEIRATSKINAFKNLPFHWMINKNVRKYFQRFIWLCIPHRLQYMAKYMYNLFHSYQ